MASEDTLLRAVQEAATPVVWSRGVDLTRADRVLMAGEDGDEVTLRVLTPLGDRTSLVTLYPDDAEWDCECDDEADPCEHVAAAVIAWRRARTGGEALPTADRHLARLDYRLRLVDGGLLLDRVLVIGGDDRPVAGSVGREARDDARVRAAVTREDVAVDRLLDAAAAGPGPLPGRLLPGLFRALSRCDSITLDGEPVTVDARPLPAQAVVTEQGDGFRVELGTSEAITRRGRQGVVICDDALRLLAPPPVTGRARDDLAGGLHFPPDRVDELVGDLLPRLMKVMPVEVRTDRLPGRVDAPPRMIIETTAAGNDLSVRPALVYGAPGRPEVARVEGERLVRARSDGPVPVRRPDAERLLQRELRAELGLAPDERVTFSGENAVAFAGRLRAWQETGGEVRGGTLPAFALHAPLQARFLAEGGGLDVAFESPAGDDAGGAGRPRRGSSAAASRVLAAWRAGESLVRLDDGGWAPLPTDWLARFGAPVADLLAARDAAGGKLPPALRLDAARLLDELDEPVPEDLAALRRRVEAAADAAAFERPGDLAVELRSYQEEGAAWLARRGAEGLGALLADDMGLGKTLQALCAVDGRTLVVAPTSVLFNWEAEIRRFRPSLDVHIYHGGKRELVEHATGVTLTTYALLRLDAEALAGVQWDTVVLDEAQNIKNPTSQAARAAWRLPAGRRIALTGTPMENRLDDLWSLFRFLNPGLLGERADFRDRYARPIADGDPEPLTRLRDRLRPFLLRRRKAEVAAELPPRTDVVRQCELGPEERQVYDAVRAATREEVVARLEAGGGVLQALEALLRLRQAACHPALVPGQGSVDASAKLDLLMDCLDEVVADGHKALVFSQWTSLLDRVEPRLGEAGVPFVRLDGSTRDRGAVVGQFQDPGGPPVLLISLKAGGTGLNLTAADHVFLLDPWWNPAVEEQAADRAHRIGQDRPVLVTRLVARNTVEERILGLQERKRALAGAALEGAATGAALTRDELLALLA